MLFSIFNKDYKEQVVQLFTQVFSASEGESEGKVIGNLVSELIDNTLNEELIGFIAIEDKQLVGAVFFSHFQVGADKKAFILSPMAIATSEQKKGYGQQLINFAIEHLKGLQVQWLVTYGDPSFYGKVGFRQIRETQIKAPFMLTYPDGWLALSLDGSELLAQGESRCVQALSHQAYW